MPRRAAGWLTASRWSLPPSGASRGSSREASRRGSGSVAARLSRAPREALRSAERSRPPRAIAPSRRTRQAPVRRSRAGRRPSRRCPGSSPPSSTRSAPSSSSRGTSARRRASGSPERLALDCIIGIAHRRQSASELAQQRHAQAQRVSALRIRPAGQREAVAAIGEQQRHRPGEQRLERPALGVAQLGQGLQGTVASAKNMTAAGRCGGPALQLDTAARRRARCSRIAGQSVDGVGREHRHPAAGETPLQAPRVASAAAIIRQRSPTTTRSIPARSRRARTPEKPAARDQLGDLRRPGPRRPRAPPAHARRRSSSEREQAHESRRARRARRTGPRRLVAQDLRSEAGALRLGDVGQVGENRVELVRHAVSRSRVQPPHLEPEAPAVGAGELERALAEVAARDLRGRGARA